MLQCPTPGCPAYASTLSAGATRCDACGARGVVTTASFQSSAAVRLSGATPGGAFPVRRLVFTLVALGVYLLATRTTLPGVDRLVVEAEGQGAALEGVSVVTLGVTPVVSAYLLLEVGTLLIGAWRARRHQAAFRAGLERWVTVLALALAAVQATGVVRWLERFNLSGVPAVPNPGPGFQAVAVLTCVAGVAGMLVWVRAVGRWGLGNGFSILVALQLLQDVLPGWMDLRPLLRAGELAPRDLFRPLFLLGLVAAATLWLLWSRPLGRVRVPPAGVVPLQVASSVVALVAQAAALWGMPLLPDPAVTLVVAAVLALLLGRLWLGASAHAWVASGWGAGFVVGASVVVDQWVRADGALAQFVALPSSVALVLAVAIGSDLYAEVEARRRLGELAVVAVLQRPSDADALAAALAEAGVRVHLRAVHHRAMLQWFGPHVPVEVMVPAHEAARALAVVGAPGA